MPKPDFVEFDRLHDPDGVGIVAILTRCDKPNGYTKLSWALYKEFERTTGGQTERTQYLNERHISAARKLLDMVESRLAVERDKLHTTRRHARAQ